MPKGTPTPCAPAPPAVRWPWDDRGRSAVTLENVKRDLRDLDSLLRTEYADGSLVGLVRVYAPGH